MTIIIGLALAPFIVLTFCFAAEVFLGLRPLRLQEPKSAAGVSAVIIVPAHDEALLLRPRLAALCEAADGRAGILLVADNCRDGTAEIARGLGVETIERFDPHRRGKGFALDLAMRHLRSDAPDVVVIMDADCVTDALSIERLIACCAATGRPCQATYLQMPTAEASPPVKLSTFAFFVKNLIRQRGLQRLAGRVHLVGTGMALPWAVAAVADLATGNIVEDLKLGQELAEAGHRPMLVENATVWGGAESDENTLSQRRRWEGGFLQNAVRVAPGLLVRGLSRGDPRNVCAAIDLMIPPLALLVLLDLAALALAGACIWLIHAYAWPILVLGSLLVIAGIAIMSAWAAGGSRFVTLGDLARIPLYVVWKLPLYLGFARRGPPTEWVRTGRGEP